MRLQVLPGAWGRPRQNKSLLHPRHWEGAQSQRGQLPLSSSKRRADNLRRPDGSPGKDSQTVASFFHKSLALCTSRPKLSPDLWCKETGSTCWSPTFLSSRLGARWLSLGGHKVKNREVEVGRESQPKALETPCKRAKSLQSCLTLSDSMGCSPPGSSVHSLGFSRQEYWSGPPCPPTGDLPDPGTEPASLTSPALAGGLFITSTTWKAP